MPATEPNALSQAQQATARHLHDRGALAASIAGQSARIAAMAGQVASLQAAGQSAQAAALVGQLAAARAQRTAQHKQYQAIDATWANAVKDLFARIDPCDADPARPLLLPVRLETRF